MKRQMTSALLAVGTAMVVTAVPAVPATAATSGKETVSGVIVVSGVSGTRRVVSSVIVAKGVFDGVGRFAEIPSLPTDPPNVSRADLIYPVGTMHLVATAVGFTSSANPRTCLFKFTLQQTAVVTGGTGKFAAASGDFTQTVTGWISPYSGRGAYESSTSACPREQVTRRNKTPGDPVPREWPRSLGPTAIASTSIAVPWGDWKVVSSAIVRSTYRRVTLAPGTVISQWPASWSSRRPKRSASRTGGDRASPPTPSG